MKTINKKYKEVVTDAWKTEKKLNTLLSVYHKDKKRVFKLVSYVCKYLSFISYTTYFYDEYREGIQHHSNILRRGKLKKYLKNFNELEEYVFKLKPFSIDIFSAKVFPDIYYDVFNNALGHIQILKLLSDKEKAA